MNHYFLVKNCPVKGKFTNFNERKDGIKAMQLLSWLINELYYKYPKEKSEALLADIGKTFRIVRMQVMEPRSNAYKALSEAKQNSIADITVLIKKISSEAKPNSGDLVESIESQIQTARDRIESSQELLSDVTDATTQEFLINKIKQQRSILQSLIERKKSINSNKKKD